MEDLKCVLNNTGIECVTIDLNNGKKDFNPRIRTNVTYIVCAVLFNDRGQILLIQEAKPPSCRGHWYLPAGRMEQNETLEEATKREVLEESGLEFEPTTLTSVEIIDGVWFRFSMTGRVTGGQLKTFNADDKESLQAQWFDMSAITSTLTLRAYDMVHVIEMAMRYQYQSSPVSSASVLPVHRPHVQMLLRLAVITANSSMSSDASVLVSNVGGRPHLPTVAFRHAHETVDQFLASVLKNSTVKPVQMSVLGVEHDGRPAHKHDGLCISVLITFPPESDLALADDSKYGWVPINDADIRQRLRNVSECAVQLELRD